MGDVDIASKVWLREAATDVARLVLRDPRLTATDVGSITLPSIGPILDGLLRVERPGRKPSWLHAELQTAWAHDVPLRTYEYWSDARRVYWPLVSCVIVLTRGERKGRPRGELDLAVDGKQVLGFRFEVLRAWELDREDLLRGPPALLPLLPFARGASTEGVEQGLTRLAGTAGTAELQAVLAVFAGHVFPGTRWLGRLPEEILMQSSTVTELLARGKAEGVVAGKAEVLCAMLESRLGPEAAPLTSLVRSAKVEVLDRLTRLLATRSIDDVELLARVRAALLP